MFSHIFDKEHSYDPLIQKRPALQYQILFWNAVIFGLSLTMFVWSMFGSFKEMDDPKAAWRIWYMDSPIIDHLNLSATPQLVRGEIENNGDVFHQAPSPQVDEAWDNLLKYNNVWVTSKELRSAGKDPEISVKLPLDYGFGPDAYAALTDIGHKFHCLDWIRKDVYVNYYAPNGSTSITDLHKAHTNHCIYILYQSIKCEASTDIMGSAWYEGRERPETEFNFKRKCGDMNGVSQWAKGRSIDGRMINKIKKPKGQRSIAISDELLRILFLQDKNT